MKSISIIKDVEDFVEKEYLLKPSFSKELLIIYLLAFVVSIWSARGPRYLTIYILISLIVVFPIYISIRIYCVIPKNVLLIERLGMAIFLSGSIGVVYGFPILVRWLFEFFSSGMYDKLIQLLIEYNAPNPNAIARSALIFLTLIIFGLISGFSMASSWIGFFVSAWFTASRKLMKVVISPFFK
jgi:hypothetical protein